MKKIAAIIISFLFILCYSFFAFAENLETGEYEVSVSLMHKEDEKESFGNKYIEPKALLKVSNDETTVTIFLSTDMKGIEFSYYINGSLKGETKKAVEVENIAMGASVYKQGFEIPVTTNGDLGLQFSVPVMPMSPSARLRIDYSSAVLLSESQNENVANTEIQTTQPQETTVTVTQNTTMVSDESTEATTTQITTTKFIETTASSTVLNNMQTTQHTVTLESFKTEAMSNEKDKSPSLFLLVLFIFALTIIVTLSNCDNMEEKDSYDK